MIAADASDCGARHKPPGRAADPPARTPDGMEQQVAGCSGASVIGQIEEEASAEAASETAVPPGARSAEDLEQSRAKAKTRAARMREMSKNALAEARIAQEQIFTDAVRSTMDQVREIISSAPLLMPPGQRSPSGKLAHDWADVLSEEQVMPGGYLPLGVTHVGRTPAGDLIGVVGSMRQAAMPVVLIKVNEAWQDVNYIENEAPSGKPASDPQRNADDALRRAAIAQNQAFEYGMEAAMSDVREILLHHPMPGGSWSDKTITSRPAWAQTIVQGDVSGGRVDTDLPLGDHRLSCISNGAIKVEVGDFSNQPRLVAEIQTGHALWRDLTPPRRKNKLGGVTSDASA